MDFDAREGQNSLVGQSTNTGQRATLSNKTPDSATGFFIVFKYDQMSKITRYCGDSNF